MGRKRGRPPRGPAQVDTLSGSASSRKRLEVILQTVGGTKSVIEACAELGVTEAHFYRLRDKALQGAVSALEPRPAGRPPRRAPDLKDEEIENLKAELLETKIDLRAAQIREELAILMPHVLEPRPGEKKKRRGRKPR